MTDATSAPLTFLFTDIEGSTRIWEQQPDAMRVALQRHDALAAEVVTSRGGRVVKGRGEGDSVFAVFPSAREAARAALELQQGFVGEPWPTLFPLRVRIALHTGEADEREGDFYGPSVNRCARLRSVAHGGQVLISGATANLVEGALPDGARLRPLGTHRLRDLARPEHIFQLVHPGLPADFPPLRTLDTVPNNLPTQLTRFIGRERELLEVESLLAKTRLLTLTGAGGAGKTRLALQVAASLMDTFPDGVWVAELAPVGEPELVPRAVAGALGLREDEPGPPILATLIEALRERRSLLVLDNCEHVVGACATLADRLLRSSDHLRILATSRQALGIAGETAWRIPSLSLPDPRRVRKPAELAEFEAVKLFADRAAAASPAFHLTEQNAPAVALICRRLDGIPLAIELAAARVKVMGVEQIAARLDDRFRLLTSGSRTALPRQQTLQALIDWSYDLLSEAERTIWRRLSAFAGDFSLADAEAVVAGSGLEPWEVLDLLSQLVDKSLVVADQEEGETRYRLLESIREYGETLLEQSGEADAIRAAHAEHYRLAAEQWEAELRGPRQGAALDALDRDHENLRAALRWALGRPDGGDLALRLAGGLWRFWWVRGHHTEGQRWLEAALAQAPDAPDSLRGRALGGAGTLARARADDERAVAFYEESLTLWRESGNRGGVASALGNLASLARHRGDYARARTLYEGSLAIRRAEDDTWGAAAALSGLGGVAADQEDLGAAETLYAESLACFRRLGDEWGVATALNGLGDAARGRGECAAAAARYAESLAIWRALGDRRSTAATLADRAALARDCGDPAAAEAFAREALGLAWEQGARQHLPECLEVVGEVLASRGDAGRAIRLLAAADGLRDVSHAARRPAEARAFERALEAGRAALSDDGFTAAWRMAQATPLERLMAEELAATVG